MVDWGRQLPILVFAAIFALWWTSRQGLWEAVSGKTPVDKQWVDARAVLLRRIDKNKYEVIDGTNTKGDKRVLIMSYTRPPADGSPMPAPLVAAELVPIKLGSKGPYGKKNSQHKLYAPPPLTNWARFNRILLLSAPLCAL